MLFRPSQPDRAFEFLIKYVNVPRTTVDSLHIVVTRHRNEPFCRAANVARQGGPHPENEYSISSIYTL